MWVTTSSRGKSQKAYLSIYTCSAERIASFTKKHPNIPCGVGCINFRDRDPFPLRDLAAVIKNAFAPSAMILDAKNTATNRQIVISFENLPFSPKLTEPPPYTASDDGKAL